MKVRAWLLVLGALAAAIGWAAMHRLGRVKGVEGAAFVTLLPGQPVRFPLRDARWAEVHVGPSRGVLQGRWLAEPPAQETAFELALDEQGQERTFRLAPPSGATGLEFTAAGPLLVRVLRGEPPREDAAPRRSHPAPRWSWKRVVPEVGASLLRAATEARQTAAVPPAPAAAANEVALLSGQTLGWAVRGPRTLSLRWRGTSSVRVALVGPAPAAVELEQGEPRALVLPSGWSWLRVDATSKGQLAWDEGVDQPLPVPTARPHHAQLLVRGAALRFALSASDGTALRLSAWSLHPGEGGVLRWRLGQQQGEQALERSAAQGTCLETEADCAAVGEQVVTQLGVPSAQGEVSLELTADAPTLVSVETLFEPGADARLRPPFDEPPAGFEWQGAPLRASRWVFLRPAGTAVSMTLSRSSALVPKGVPEPRATQSLPPAGARQSTVVLEPGEGRGAAFVPIDPGVEREVRVDSEGANARRLGLSCLTSEVGSSVGLQVDGKAAGERRFSSTDLLWELSAAPGLHRVKLSALASARCHLVVRPATGGLRKRTVYPAGEGALEWVVTTTLQKRSRVLGFAVYGQAAALGPDASVEVRIDGGHPRRVAGAISAVTAGSRSIRLGGGALEVKTLNNARAFDRLAVVRVMLGDDLAPGPHHVAVGGVDAGALWYRAWADGHRAKPERAEGWITTEEP